MRMRNSILVLINVLETVTLRAGKTKSIEEAKDDLDRLEVTKEKNNRTYFSLTILMVFLREILNTVCIISSFKKFIMAH